MLIASGQVTIGVSQRLTRERKATSIRRASPTLSLVTSIDGITLIVPASPDPFVGGAPAEDDDEYRERLLQKSRASVAGGNKTDWEGWALQTPNVRAVRVYDPVQGGQVIVYTLFTREAKIS